MPLDSQCQAIVDAAAQAGSPFDTDDPKLLRSGYAATTVLYRHQTPALDSVANLVFAGPESNIPLRIYRPRTQGDAPLPALIFFHGGGWVVGDLDTHDHMCRHLAGNSGAIVVAVDYRLAPEHKFPAPFDDALAAVHWVDSAAAELNIDPKRLAIGGDSAGANLTAAVALAVRDAGAPLLKLQLLIYPAVDFLADNDSLKKNGTGYLLTKVAVEQFTGWYLPDRISRSNPHASPQQALDHSGLPPAFIQTAEYDPLLDEGKKYTDTLEHAGVEVEYTCYMGMIHGFMRMGAKVDKAITALDDAAQALRIALA
ncbi:MAG: alpha/beta hydrolase [Gammaproteobacteria bacterium]